VPRRFGFLLVALALSVILARESDEISWTPLDGAPGWRTPVPSKPHPDAVVATPLLAPTWFAKLPNATFQLAPVGSFELASARGKVLLLDYWASWCGPCLKELPHLQRLHVARGGEGLVALAVNADEEAAAASESAKRLGLTMMIGVNEPEVYRSLGVRTLPSLFAVDKKGRLRARWDGYRIGVEKEIAATVDKLLADDESGTTREMATILVGQGRLQARWCRDLPGTADGVVGLPSGIVGGARVVASGGDQLLSFDAEGEVIARLKTGTPVGRLLDFGTTADGTRELVGFRPGGTALDVIALRSGTEHTIAVPAPLLDVAVSNDAAGGARRLAMATMSGAALAAASDDRAKFLDGGAGVRSVAPLPGGGVLALHEDGTLGALGASTPVWAHPAAGAERLLVARDNGAVTAPRSVTAAVSGQFLAEGGRQLAVATYAGHVALLDEASGRVLFDAVWAGVHDLAAADLDGDGRDELLVAAGRSVTALGATGH
jgi:thiol-disulfide isomerase/thioredoxin